MLRRGAPHSLCINQTALNSLESRGPEKESAERLWNDIRSRGSGWGRGLWEVHPLWFVLSVSEALSVKPIVPAGLIGNSLSTRHWWEHDDGESFTSAFQGKHNRDVDVHRRPSWTGTVTELSKNKQECVFMCVFGERKGEKRQCWVAIHLSGGKLGTEDKRELFLRCYDCEQVEEKLCGGK